MHGLIIVLVESPEVDSLAHQGSLIRVVLEKPVRAAIFIWADEVVAHVPATPCLRLKSIFWSC